MAADRVFRPPLSGMTSGEASAKNLPTTTRPAQPFNDSTPSTIVADGTLRPAITGKEATEGTSGSPDRTTNTNTRSEIAALWQEGSLDPINWPIRRKWAVTALCCLITFLTGWNATALTAATSKTNAYFHISDESFPHSVWAVTSWNLGAAIAPMVVLPIMEEHGTRPGYLAVYALFFIFVIPQAITTSYGVFCGMRFIAGCCAGVLQTCMDGVIADVWRDSVRMSVPVSCYVGSLLSGVSSGPVFGAIVSGAWRLSWKWIVYFQLIIYGILALPVYFVFAETRLPVILAAAGKRSQKHEQGTLSPITEDLIITQPRPSAHPHASLIEFLRSNILRPFHLLFTEPVVFFFTLLSALSYGITFISTQSVAQVYSTTYAFTEPQTGYIQAAIVLGELVGWALCAGVQDPFYARCAKRAAEDETGESTRTLPEKRLRAAVPASFLALAAGLFVYGFSSHSGISLYAPASGLFLIGVGVVVVMQAIMMYVTDAYARYAASASAAVCFGENVFAAFLPLGSQGMYSALGYGWASGLLGCVAVGLGLAPVLLGCLGVRVRGRSKFMREAGYA